MTSLHNHTKSAGSSPINSGETCTHKSVNTQLLSSQGYWKKLKAKKEGISGGVSNLKPCKATVR